MGAGAVSAASTPGAKAVSERPLHSRLYSLSQIEQATEGRITRRQLEGWIYSGQSGIGRCVLRVGDGPRPRILIDVAELDAWLEERRASPRPRLQRARADEHNPKPRFARG